MKTFAQLKDVVYKNVGKAADDPAAAVLVPEAVNQATLLAALLFDPPELRATIPAVSLVANTNSISLGASPFDRPLAINTIYDTTDSVPLWYLPIEQWDILVPAALATLKFFTLDGLTLLFQAQQTTTKSLLIRYSKYPTIMDAEDSTPGFDYHDSWITSLASSSVQAGFEETDAASIWASAEQGVGQLLQIGQQRRAIVRGQPTTLMPALNQVIGSSK